MDAWESKHLGPGCPKFCFEQFANVLYSLLVCCTGQPLCIPELEMRVDLVNITVVSTPDACGPKHMSGKQARLIYICLYTWCVLTSLYTYYLLVYPASPVE